MRFSFSSSSVKNHRWYTREHVEKSDHAAGNDSSENSGIFAYLTEFRPNGQRVHFFGSYFITVVFTVQQFSSPIRLVVSASTVQKVW